jgi:dipeptidyl aminopeptidase/acylaminoacyl peptidase
MPGALHIPPYRGVGFLLLFALSLCLGTTPMVRHAASTPLTGWTPEAMMHVKTVANVQVSPDGHRVVFTVTEAIMTDDKSANLTHIHMANIDSSDARQMTYGDKSCTSPQWSPDGRWIAFTSERSGKQNIWLLRADGGEAHQVTDVKTRVSSFRWSPESTQIAFIMPDALTADEEKAQKGKNDAQVVDEHFKMSRLWVIPIKKDASGKHPARLLTKGEFSVGRDLVPGWFDWSPDGRTIVFTHVPTPRVNDWPLSDISTVDVATGEIKPVARTGAAEGSPLYSPDGRWIAYMASDDPPTWAGTSDVFVVPVSGGPPRKLAETFDRLPPSGGAHLLGWSADGQGIFFTETRGTVTRVSVLPVNGEPPQDLDRGDTVMFSMNLNPSRTMLGFTAQTTTRPPEAYITPLDRFAPVQVSRMNADLPDYPLGRTDVIRWKSSDGVEIEGLLTYPVGYEPGTRYPLLLLIHGGPAGVFTQTFIANHQWYPVATFATQGYAILRPNIRGSSGYGKQWRYANYNDWGGMDYQDLMAGVDHVIQLGVADGARLGVMGWSYGGYMTSWVITHTKRFKAASVGAGITNLMSFTGTTDILGFVPDYFGAELWENLDIYQAHSAMFNVKGVSTPTLIQHGEADARVPISQGYELYNALKRQNVPVKMVVYPRAPHGPQEPKQVLDIAKRNVEWFAHYLRQERSATKE